MTAKSLPEVLLELESSVKGLRLEVEGWRMHTGSASHFMMVEIDRLIDVLNELKGLIK
jgi:hypothetical protein